MRDNVRGTISNPSIRVADIFPANPKLENKRRTFFAGDFPAKDYSSWLFDGPEGRAIGSIYAATDPVSKRAK